LHWDAGGPLPLAFCGSKAGATFCLAMISISSGLKTRASQRCRNNCLMLEMEMRPRQISRWAATPHHAVSGGGGWRAISRPKTELQSICVVTRAYRGNRSKLLAQQDRERQRTVQINRDLCPNSPGDVLNVVKLDRLGRNTRDVLNLVASLRVLEPAIEPAG
jgi:hypothetical protein